MTGQELTNRLIDDIKIVIKAKSTAKTTDQILNSLSDNILNPSQHSKYRGEELQIAMSCQNSIPDELGVITQFINYYERITNYSKGDDIDLNQYLQELEEKKEKVEDTFQRIIDNNNLKTDDIPEIKFSDILYQRLNYLHNDAENVKNYYRKITEGK